MFGSAMAFWLNQRSRVVRANVNTSVGQADLVWVFSQDPIEGAVRAALQRDLARVRPGVRVINPLEVYNAYHDDDCFPRLAAAGVRVPRHSFDARDVGATEVVYKAQGEQVARKFRDLYRGPVPGFRVFSYIDSRGPDGLFRRYRAYYMAGAIFATDVLIASSWQVSASTSVEEEYGFELTLHEREQVALVAQTLHLDFFCVDFLRQRGDSAPFVVDVNVYPNFLSTLGKSSSANRRGRWHDFELASKPRPDRIWSEVDAAFLRLAGRTGHQPGRL